MNNFEFYSPTRILFGKGSMNKIHEHVPKIGKRVLLVYGKGSIKHNGIYDTVMRDLSDCKVVELSGVEPNPKIESVMHGANLCRKHQIEVVMAIGGGSSFDCAKAIAAATYYEGDAWDLVIGQAKVTKALPVVCVVTMSATGSEMNNVAVISNMKTHQKIGLHDDLLCPVLSILDPENLYSVPPLQTAAGTADILSHLWEQFFTNVEDAYLQDGLAVGAMKACIHYGPIAIQEPTNYSARANLMWAAPMALNGLLKTGYSMAWSCHGMEHVLSAYYDITHGVGLAILTPRWMRYVLDEKTVSRFKKYGVEVWGLDASKDDYWIANKAIEKTETFLYETLGLPSCLQEVGIDDTKLEEMAKSCIRDKGGPIQGFKTLYEEDILQIFRNCL